MRIRTPKKYRGVQRRGVIPCGRIMLWGVLIALIGSGIFIYQHSDAVRPQVQRIASTAVADINMRAATISAPPPTATQDPATNRIAGDNAWSRGDIPSALERYESILGSVPNDPTIHARVALSYYVQGAGEQALQYANQAVTADPYNVDAWELLTLIQAGEGDAQLALASARQALDLEPGSPAATAYLGYAYLILEQYELARTRAEEAISTDPNHFAGYWVRGNVREEVDFDFPGALRDFQQSYDLAVDQNPALAEDIGLAIALVQLNQAIRAGEGDFSQSIGTLNNILEVNPRHAGSLQSLGAIYYSRVGDANQALEPLQRCIEVDPDNYTCHYLLGRTQSNLGDQIAALESFERAVELDTPRAQHYYWAAQTHALALGNCSDAEPFITTGYRMAVQGDLPAEDEGQWISDFQYLLSTCGLTVSGVQPATTPTPVPEATQEPATGGQV